MHRNNEKSKDFFGTMLKLFKNLDHWRYLLIIAVFFAFSAFGTVFGGVHT